MQLEKLLNQAGFFEQTHPKMYETIKTIRDKTQIELLTKSFALLIKSKLSEKTHERLYIDLIKNRRFSINLAEGFVALKQANLSYESHPIFYECLTNNARKIDDLPANLIWLDARGFSEQTYPISYKSLMTMTYGSSTFLAQGLNLLIQEGFAEATHSKFYEAIIHNSQYAQSLAKGLITLRGAELSAQSQSELYRCIISNAKYADNLAKNLILLNTKKTNETGCPKSYQYLMQIGNDSIFSLAEGLALLIEEKFTEETHPYFFKVLTENSKHAENLANGFISLIRENLEYSSHKKIYTCLINNAIFAKELAINLVLLNKKGFTEITHPKSYKNLIQTRNGYAFALAQGLNLLIDAKISEIEHPELYLTLSYANHPKLLAENIAALFQANLSVNTHSEIYELFFDEPTIQINEILDLLKDIGITYSEHNKKDEGNINQFFSKNLLIKHIELSTFILDSLKKSGYILAHHKAIIIKVLSGLLDDFPNRTELTNLLSSLVQYTHSNKLLAPHEKGYATQIKELDKLLAQQEISLIAGPIEKSVATLEIERVLKLISTLNTSQVRIRFDNFLEHYILDIPNEPEINLSILLKNSNLTQLILNNPILNETGEIVDIDHTILNSLDNKLKTFIENLDIDSSKNPILELLPSLQQKAIKLYTGKFYLNINKLFRSEALDNTPNNLIVSNSIEINYLIFFLLGCLATDALNKLPVLISKDIERFKKQFKQEFDKRYSKQDPKKAHPEFKRQLKEKLIIKYGEFLVPKDALLDRGEHLDVETIRRRLANSWSFPALTSFSALPNGDSNFHSSGEIRTKLENLPSIRPIIYKDEEEMLLAPGTQVITTQWSKGLISRIVNSPSLVQPNACWSDTAIAYAFKNYLSQEYRDEKSEIIINGKHLNRPNHNVTHIVRVIKMINLVLDYFAKYAKDPEFKEFCETLTAKDIEWLKTAAAFSITGRESEIGAREYPDLYAQYRENSANHFMRFVNEAKSLGMSQDIKMKERMYDIIQYMGNPYYEQGTHKQNTINNIFDETERKLRVSYHRLLSIAHKFDLARCKSAKDYMDSLKICLDLSKQSPLQKEDFKEIIRYNIELIKAHGSCLTCDIKPNGKIIDVCQDYRNIFLESSTSLKKLRERTESIPLPKFSRNISSGYKKSN